MHSNHSFDASRHLSANHFGWKWCAGFSLLFFLHTLNRTNEGMHQNTHTQSDMLWEVVTLFWDAVSGRVWKRAALVDSLCSPCFAHKYVCLCVCVCVCVFVIFSPPKQHHLADKTAQPSLLVVSELRWCSRAPDAPTNSSSKLLSERTSTYQRSPVSLKTLGCLLQRLLALHCAS